VEWRRHGIERDSPSIAMPHAEQSTRRHLGGKRHQRRDAQCVKVSRSTVRTEVDNLDDIADENTAAHPLPLFAEQFGGLFGTPGDPTPVVEDEARVW
jgi:hypothetical protein